MPEYTFLNKVLFVYQKLSLEIYKMLRISLKKSLISAIMLLFAGRGMCSSLVLIPLKEAPKPVQVEKAHPGYLVLDISVPTLLMQEVSSPTGEPFTHLQIEGEYATLEPGYPQLPVIRRLIRVPADKSLEVSFEDSSTTDLILKTYHLPNNIWPAQPSMPKRPDVKPRFHEPDKRAYSQKTHYPIAELTDLGILRHERIYRLDIYPINYDPKAGILHVRKSLRLTLTEALGKAVYTPPPSPLFSKLTVPFLRTSESPPSLIQSPPGYLIVTPSEFMPTLEDFIAWKIQRGFLVDVILTESLGIVDTATIRDAIHQRYLNPPPGKVSPSFLLLVGDEEIIPPFLGYNNTHFTDLPYVTVTEGDYLPDMYNGRLVVQTPTELAHHLNKILWVEQYTYQNPSHLNQAMLIAGWDASWARMYGYPAVNYAYNHYMNPSHGFQSHIYLSSYPGEFTQAVRTQLHSGHGFIYYTGHGSAQSWHDPSVTSEILHEMQSFGAAPLVITNGCQTSNFAIDSCFSETWVTLENKGASAVIGATNDSYWDEDLWWAVGLYSIGPDGRTPTPQETGPGMFDIPFTRTDLDNPSALIYTGNLAVSQAASPNSRYYWEIYELMGDPSMTLRLGESENLLVFADSTITWHATSFTVDVNGVSDALVGLTQEDSLISSGYTDEWGLITLTFPPISSLKTLTLTVTAPGYIPVEKSLSVKEPSHLITDKDTLFILTPETLTMTVHDNEGFPLENINIWASSPGYTSDTVFTAVDGKATLTLVIPYGPEVTISFYDPLGFFPLLKETLVVVGGQDFLNPSLHLYTEYGVQDSLVLGIPTTLIGKADISPLDVWYSQDGFTFVGGNDTLSVLTTKRAPLSAAITAPGYNIYTKTFPVVTLYTNLYGTVIDTHDNPIPNAEIKISGENYRSYTFFTDVSGNFESTTSLIMEPLQVQINKFGYEKKDTLIIPHWPVDSLTFSLSESQRVEWVARVYDMNGEPLRANYRFFIGTSDSLFAEGYCTAAQDSNLIISLPSYLYTLVLTHPGYVPIQCVFHPEDYPYANIPMSLRNGILIINDDFAKHYADKEKNIPLQQETSANSALLMAELLQDAGFSVTVKTGSQINPALLSTYNGVIYSRGADQNAVGPSMQTALKNYYNLGGPLLLEGGELAYEHYEDDFGHSVLRIKNWIIDKGGSVILTPEGRQWMADFYPLPNVIEHEYTVYGDQDVVDPAPGILSIATWSQNNSYSSLLFAPDTMAYMTFNFAALKNPIYRHHLLFNVIRLLPFVNPYETHPPYAWIDVYDVTKDTQIIINPLETVWDPDGDSLTLLSVNAETLLGYFQMDSTGQKIIYTAPSMSNVSDTVYYTVSDGHFTDEGMIVLNINTPPTAVTLLAPPNYYVNRDSTSLVFRWTAAFDADGDPLSYVLSLSQDDGLQVHDTLLVTHDTLLHLSPTDLGFVPDLLIFWHVWATDGKATSQPSDIWYVTMDSSAFNTIRSIDLLPTTFSAGPNYPNPFNPTTLIPLALPESDEITLTIYDIRGATIFQLGPLPLQAGYHTLQWDGKNRRGQPVGNGIYLGRIQTRKGYSASLKMIFLK